MNILKAIFTGAFGFLKPFARMFAIPAAEALATAATRAVAVTAQSMADAHWTDKRDNAYELIVDDLKAQGIAIGTEVGTSMINSAIELAVRKLKEK